MKSKQLQIVSVGIVFIVLLYVISFITKQPHLNIPNVYTVPDSFASAAPLNGSTLIYSNGRSLVEYNYQTGSTRALLSGAGVDDLNTLDSLSVSPDKQRLLFHTTGVPDGSSLASKLRDQNVDPSNDYWWIFSLQSGDLHPLVTDNMLQAQWDKNGQISVLSGTSSNEKIYLYNPDGAEVSATAVHLSNNYFVTGNQYLLETTDGILETQDGVLNHVLFPQQTLLGLTADNQGVIAAQGEGKDRSIVQLNLFKKSQRTLIKGIVNQPLLLNGTIFYQTDTNTQESGAFASYNLTTHKATSWTLPRTIADTLQPAALLNPTAALLVDGQGNYYEAGTSFAKPSVPPVGYQRTLNVNGQTVRLNYDGSVQALLVNLGLQSTPVSSDQLNMVYAQLQKDGYNPDLVSLQIVTEE